jgi:hypothetical protein
MKSGGEMSSQSPVVWWYREVNYEVAGMCVEAVPVLGAESVDFFFNWYNLQNNHSVNFLIAHRMFQLINVVVFAKRGTVYRLTC